MSNPGVLAAIAIAIAVAACSDSTDRNEPAPPPVPPPVVVRTDPATAAECPYGGSVVKSGFDANHNGVLDDAEVANRTVLCNDPPAAPPPPLVVRLVAEPAGAHCTLGGTAVQSGHDRNGNGRLDDAEIEHVDYVCGVPLLTRLAAEPPGPRCIAGGVAFLVGRDRNGDGQLGDDEVEQTELACGDELARDVAIQSAADAAALANIAVIDGSLTVDGTALAELALPRLVQIRGAVVIVHDDHLAAISLPALQAIDGGFVVEHDPELASLDLPALRRTGGLSVVGDAQLSDLAELSQLAEVRGDVRIADNERLGRAGLPLRRIDGSLTIEGNPALSRVAWLLIGPLGALRIASNPALHSVELPGFLDAPGTAAGSLGAVGEVTIASNAQLTDLSLTASDIAAIAIADNPALAGVTLETVQIDGALVVDGDDHLAALGLAHLAHAGSIELAHCAALPALDLLALSDVGGGIDVRGNAALQHLRLPVLHRADLGVFDNPHLPACEVAALFAAMLGDHHQSGNDDTAVCGP